LYISKHCTVIDLTDDDLVRTYVIEVQTTVPLIDFTGEKHCTVIDLAHDDEVETFVIEVETTVDLSNC